MASLSVVTQRTPEGEPVKGRPSSSRTAAAPRSASGRPAGASIRLKTAIPGAGARQRQGCQSGIGDDLDGRSPERSSPAETSATCARTSEVEGSASESPMGL